MVNLTKSHARNALVESGVLFFSCSTPGGNGEPQPWANFNIRAETYDELRDRPVYYTMRLDRAETERLNAYLTKMLAENVDADLTKGTNVFGRREKR